MGVFSRKKSGAAEMPEMDPLDPSQQIEPSADLPAAGTEATKMSEASGEAAAKPSPAPDAPAETPPTAFTDKPEKKAKKKKSESLSDEEVSKRIDKLPPVKTPKVPWRQRVTLATLMLWTVLSGILLAGGAAGYYALRVLYENKLNDTWAILYLELEQKGNRLNQQLETFAAQRGNPLAIPKRPPDNVLRVMSPERLERVRGNFPEVMTLADLHLTAMELKDRFNLFKFQGVNYLTLPGREGIVSQMIDSKVEPGSYMMLWKIEIDNWFADSADDSDKNTLYLITKEGRVVYSNDPEITEANFMKRPLVQKFVAAPLRQGQLEFNRDDGPAYGFFYEVPNTNLMMFVETSKKVALAAVRELAIQYGIVFLMILSIAGVVLQFPVSAFISPIRELVRLAWEIGEGNFQIQPREAGFGELNVLTTAFAEMGRNLVAREERIQLLLVEQQEKFRLVDELSLAQSIQNNFLLQAALPRSSGVEVATHYSPAAQVAGDWYGYFHDEKSGQSVFAIADVSGHGAASAMFTAIIAALFEETRAASIATQKPFPMDVFAMRLNRLFLKLGHGQMHCTLLLARYQQGESELTVMNAGHPFPMLVYPEESGRKAESVISRTDIVGVNANFEPKTQAVPFEPGTSLLMYTDGLIEGRPDHKLYTERRLRKACKIPQHFTVNQLVLKVQEDWQAFLEGQPASDDVCLMAVRRA